MEKKTSNWFPWDYFLVTFGFAWFCWLPGVLDTQGLLRLPLPWEAFFLLGIFGPLVGAIWATVRRNGWEAARGLLARVADVRIGLAWWLVILIVPLLLPALALLGFELIGGEAGELPVLSNPWLILPTILLMTLLGGGQEEFGWRGYALDVLQERWGAVTASIVLGLIWGVWHLPLFFIQGTGQYYMPLWVFIVTSPALSILETWAYNSAGQRLFAAWLLHGTLNAGMDLFPPIQKTAGGDQRAFLILCALFWVWATIVIALFGGARLARQATGAREQA